MNPLLDVPARPVFAHPGASGYAPENTLHAFELALQQGADALELDVRLTRDGAAVVMHDETVDRTTSLSGPVRSHTLAELRLGDAGAWFTPDRGRTHPFAGAGVRVPTLAEVLWSFPSVPVLIEVKEPEVQEAVRRGLVEENASGSEPGSPKPATSIPGSTSMTPVGGSPWWTISKAATTVSTAATAPPASSCPAAATVSSEAPGSVGVG